MRAVPLHSANHLYLRTPPVGNHSYLAMLERIFQHSPEATFLFHVNVQTIIMLNAAHTHFFCTKIHFFLKKFAYVHFL